MNEYFLKNEIGLYQRLTAIDEIKLFLGIRQIKYIYKNMTYKELLTFEQIDYCELQIRYKMFRIFKLKNNFINKEVYAISCLDNNEYQLLTKDELINYLKDLNFAEIEYFKKTFINN